MIVRNVGSVSYVGVICCKEVAPNLRVTVVHEHMFVGLANTVYIHRIWPYIRWFFCQKYRIHTVYIYRVLANPTCLLCVLAPSQCIFVPFFACRAGTWELKLGCLAPANASLFLFLLAEQARESWCSGPSHQPMHLCSFFRSQSRLARAEARVPRTSQCIFVPLSLAEQTRVSWSSGASHQPTHLCSFFACRAGSCELMLGCLAKALSDDVTNTGEVRLGTQSYAFRAHFECTLQYAQRLF
jgi:hypothetical protein